jgi:fibronectin-binding autotransporter adhesin
MHPSKNLRPFAVVILLLAPCHATAQLSWGTNAAGGSGQWDSTTANWFNGTTNVAWVSGDTATFRGTPGTVFVSLPQTVSGLTFNTTGSYTLAGSNLNGTASGLSITATSSATFNCPIEGAPNTTLTESGTGTLTLNTGISGFSAINITGTIAGGSIGFSSANALTITTSTAGAITSSFAGTGTVTKTGAGTLTLGGTGLNFGQLTISTGTVALTSGTLATMNLANVAGVTLKLPASAITGALSGGGAIGGIITPANSGPTFLSLQGTGTATFAGVIQNGPGTLSLGIQSPNIIQTLTGPNTYTGVTSIAGGTLVLLGGGTIANASVLDASLFTIDNRSGNSPNRLSDTAAFTMSSGAFEYIGANGAASTETVGTLVPENGYNQVLVDPQTNGTAVVTFSGLSQGSPTALINFTGATSRVLGISNTNGIIGAFCTYGRIEWAAVDANQDIIPYAAYSTNIASASATDNVKLANLNAVTLPASATINSLNLQNNLSTAETCDLGGNQLQISSGGILCSGTGAAAITDGSIYSGNSHLFVTNINSNSLTIGAAIIDTASPVGLVTSGPAGVILTGANTFTGGTTVNGGSLQLGNGGTTGSLSATGAISGVGLVLDRSDAIAEGVDFGPLYVGSLTQMGSGTVTLSGGNSINSLKVQSGTVAFNAVSAGLVQEPLGNSLLINLGTTGGTATLQYTGPTAAMAQNLLISGQGVITNAGGGVLSLTGLLELNNGGVLVLAGGKIIDAGNTDQLGSTAGLTIGNTLHPNATTVGLTAANTYNGTTIIGSGSTLLTGHGNSLPQFPSEPLTLGSASDTGDEINTLDILGQSVSVTALNSAGNGTGQIISSNGTANINPASGTQPSTAAGTLTVTYSGSTPDTFSGSLGGSAGLGNFGLTSSGTGTLVLSGTNAYTGATKVTAGTVIIGNGLANTASIAVSSGATLDLASGNFSTPGTIVNSGKLVLGGGVKLGSVGTFTNNGTLDLSADPTFVLPANFINNGQIIYPAVASAPTDTPTMPTWMVLAMGSILFFIARQGLVPKKQG